MFSAEDECLEVRDVVGAGVHGEVLEQVASDTEPLVGVLDEERHLGDLAGVGRVFVDHVVPADGDHLVADECDQRHAVVVVDVGEVAQLVGG